MVTGKRLPGDCDRIRYINQNHLGSALMMVESSSRTPLYINFHERASGKANDLSKGHTTIIAPSNAGKTTLMLALDAQSKKYHNHSFFFDRDRGCEIYVRAMGGYYTAIHPEEPTGFNPLALADTASNRDFLITWLASLLVISQDDILSAQELKLISNVIARNYTLPTEQRNLSTLAQFFPSQFSRLDHLQPWLRAVDANHTSGRLAYLFDHNQDQLTLDHSMVGFDMTHLLDHEKPEVIFSVMIYLFHRLDSIMDGHLVGIYLDEGGQTLDNP